MFTSVLPPRNMCCSVLNMLQCVAVYCSVCVVVAVCCNVLQRFAAQDVGGSGCF